MPSVRRFSVTIAPGLCLGVFVCLLGGCELFPDAPGVLRTAKKPELPALKPHPESIQLEIVFVERPVGDSLLGETLWQHVDQIVNLEPEAQRNLERNGFRVGVVGSLPPDALQGMLGLNSRPDKTETSGQELPLSGNRVFIRSGTTTEVQVSPNYPECDFKLFPTSLSDHGEVRAYSQARCVYRLTAHRVQNGWARLDFLPEVLHGEERMRPRAGQQEWELVASQKSERLWSHRFSVNLNVGDMALVTARPEHEGTAGHRFFCGPEGADQIQRLLLVRLSSMGNPEE